MWMREGTNSLWLVRQQSPATCFRIPATRLACEAHNFPLVIGPVILEPCKSMRRSVPTTGIWTLAALAAVIAVTRSQLCLALPSCSRNADGPCAQAVKRGFGVCEAPLWRCRLGSRRLQMRHHVPRHHFSHFVKVT